MRYRVKVTATWPEATADDMAGTVQGERDIRAVSRRHALDKALARVQADYPTAREHTADILDGPADYRAFRCSCGNMVRDAVSAIEHYDCPVC
jgi:hypothetical protein